MKYKATMELLPLSAVSAVAMSSVVPLLLLRIIESASAAPYHTLTAPDLPVANPAAARPAPLKGFLTSPEWHSGGYADPQHLNDPPTTLEFYYIGLSDVMDGMDSFPGLDSVVEPRVAASASRGKHAILRVSRGSIPFMFI